MKKKLSDWMNKNKPQLQILKFIYKIIMYNLGFVVCFKFWLFSRRFMGVSEFEINSEIYHYLFYFSFLFPLILAVLVLINILLKGYFNFIIEIEIENKNLRNE